MTDLLLFLHHLDQIIINLLWIAVQDPYPPQPFDLAQLLKKHMQGFLSVQIFSIESRLLRHKDQLLHSLPGQLFCFFYKPLHRNAPVIPPNLRDNAVCAMLVAPFRDLHISIMPACRHKPPPLRQHKGVYIFQAHMPCPFKRLLHDLVVSRSPEDRVHFRYLFYNLLAVSLRQAAGDDQRLQAPLLLIFRHLQDRLYALFFCIMDEAARVDHNDIGGLFLIHDLESLPIEKAQHHFRVHKILIAPKGDEQYLRLQERQTRGCICLIPLIHLLLPKWLSSPGSARRSLQTEPYLCSSHGQGAWSRR